MRKIREVLRLINECGVSRRNAARACSLGRATISEYMLRFEASGLSWPLPAEIDDDMLEKRLFPTSTISKSNHKNIDLEYIFKEIRRPNMTLVLLWNEYIQSNPGGYSYSQFCNLYREYARKTSYSMRQEHKAGEKAFLDFAEGLPLLDLRTGELVPTRLFVFVWGASNYMYAHASLGEDLASWIKLNTMALSYFGCCPKALVPDNLKSAVMKVSRYEPEINPTYLEFARHYGTTIFPARPYKPKDKAKAENGVKLAKRWILASLRNEIFSDLDNMNAAIETQLRYFNNKTMKHYNKSRQELFDMLDRPNALPLPDKPYEFAQWKKVTVNINYHIEFDEHNYSAPYTLIHQELEVRATSNIVEIYRKNARIYSHRRSYKRNGYTTMAEHMPPSHRKYKEWSPERIIGWAKKSGDSAGLMVEHILSSRRFPEQAYRACIGIIRLSDHYGHDRLNNACRRALEYKSYSFRAVSNILKRGLDEKKSNVIDIKTRRNNHHNIRGAEYFKSSVKKSKKGE